MSALGTNSAIRNSYFRYRRCGVHLSAYSYWNRLSAIKLFSTNGMHIVLELELEQTSNDYPMF